MIKSIDELVQESLPKAMSYSQYRDLVANLAKDSKSTGPSQTDDLAKYTKLNDRRMKRWDKLFKINETATQTIRNTAKNHTWLVLTESWCGDASPALPVMEKVTAVSTAINLKVILRDENVLLMNRFLTNGGMSIPKLIVWDNTSQNVLGSWGPRSQNAAKLVEEHKGLHGTILPGFKEELQIWYNTDKGQSILKELVALLALK
ncbi:thioredoxin family protein [Maribacter antarcticus]|uniref:thioredoxin family protein n=1 Tax=Maribacter antarcticus TaxID=505250 RepID=UPI00056845CF|nr:thioredoxin family protein [Maribacter antarcticus]